MVYILDDRYKNLRPGSWIGCDLDGTCAKYAEIVPIDVIGEPLWPMIERMRVWVQHNIDVRMMTARMPLPGQTMKCLVTGRHWSYAEMNVVIGNWSERLVGKRLIGTCIKDFYMVELWDDRAIQMVPNTGRTLAEEHLAEMTALRGKP